MLKRLFAPLLRKAPDSKEETPCFECGAPSQDNHHVVPKSAGGKATVPLCVDCHRKAHNFTEEAELRRQIRRALLTLVNEYGFNATQAGRVVGLSGSTARRIVKKNR